MTPCSAAVADRRAAEEVRGQRDVEQLAPGAARDAVDLLGDAPGDLVARRDPRRVRLAVALLADHRCGSRAWSALGEGRDRVVQVLHDQRDHRALTPPPRVEQAQRALRVLAGVLRTAASSAARRCPRARRRRSSASAAAPSRWTPCRSGRARRGCRGRVDRRRDRHAVGEVEVAARPVSRPAPTIDSELVRVSTPSWSDSSGSLPVSRILNSSFWVP